MQNHLPPINNQRHEQEPRVEPQLLGPRAEILPLLLEVPPLENRLVEDVGLEEEASLAGPHVLAEVELPNPARDLADLPPVQAGSDELGAVGLLVIPELHVGLEDLVEVVALRSPQGREIADSRELAVGVLHQGSEIARDVFLRHFWNCFVAPFSCGESRRRLSSAERKREREREIL